MKPKFSNNFSKKSLADYQIRENNVFNRNAQKESDKDHYFKENISINNRRFQVLWCNSFKDDENKRSLYRDRAIIEMTHILEDKEYYLREYGSKTDTEFKKFMIMDSKNSKISIIPVTNNSMGIPQAGIL